MANLVNKKLETDDTEFINKGLRKRRRRRSRMGLKRGIKRENSRTCDE